MHPIILYPSKIEPDCQKHTFTMELDTIMQIIFGIFTISIAVFGIWFAWYNARGKSLHFPLGYTLRPHYSLTPR